MCTSFQSAINKSTSRSVIAFYQASSSSSYFTVERTAKTLCSMLPCTPVSIPAKITWYFLFTSQVSAAYLLKMLLRYDSFCETRNCPYEIDANKTVIHPCGLKLTDAAFHIRLPILIQMPNTVPTRPGKPRHIAK